MDPRPPLIAMDLEGVFIPEIWIAVAERTGIAALRRTTRDEPDYDKLMGERIAILRERDLSLADIQQVIATLDPLPGAAELLDWLRERAPLVILSDTFYEFVSPLLPKLGRPTIFCNALSVADGRIVGYRMRQADGKRNAVEGFHALGFRVFAAGAPWPRRPAPATSGATRGRSATRPTSPSACGWATATTRPWRRWPARTAPA